ncbi:MAG: hypothetical protein KDA46_13935 [Parvularculaceae bacterium]|nr:hypothetical protein [Parvularculaceae bacterium]
MVDLKLSTVILSVGLFAAGPCLAQTGDMTAAQDQGAQSVNEDNIAASLNARQSLEQTVTLKRTINGEVIETKKETVTYKSSDPMRQTEAGQSALERVKASFDSELLTRAEALEEAKLDFVLADQDRNSKMSQDEFVALVLNWREMDTRKAISKNEELGRQQRYIEFIEDIDPQSANLKTMANARSKFAFMAGAAPTLSQRDYLREVMLDFDSMDKDGDGLLRGDELVAYRAANRGQAIGG